MPIREVRDEVHGAVKGNADHQAGKMPERRRCASWIGRPWPPGAELELRQVHDPSGYAESDPTGELMKKEQQLRAPIAGQQAR